jgi:hypothetical protein
VKETQHKLGLVTCRKCGQTISPETLAVRKHLAKCHPTAARAIADEYSMVEVSAKRTAEECKLGYSDAA